MKIHNWQDLRDKKLSAQEQREVDDAVEAKLLEMDLRAMRELLGMTQADLARTVEMTQSEVSRLERRPDHRLSTLRRMVRGLGGDLEVIATFGDKKVRLRGTD